MQCKEWSDMMGYIKNGTELPKSLKASKSQWYRKEGKHLFKKNKVKQRATSLCAVLHVGQSFTQAQKVEQGFSSRNKEDLGGHSQLSLFKRWSSMLRTLGQFVFFTDFVCDWSCSFFASEHRSTALGNEDSWLLFWSLKSFGLEKQSRFRTARWGVQRQMCQAWWWDRNSTKHYGKSN